MRHYKVSPHDPASTAMHLIPLLYHSEKHCNQLKWPIFGWSGLNASLHDYHKTLPKRLCAAIELSHQALYLLDFYAELSIIVQAQPC
jgi:hypothetical protein